MGGKQPLSLWKWLGQWVDLPPTCVLVQLCEYAREIPGVAMCMELGGKSAGCRKAELEKSLVSQLGCT